MEIFLCAGESTARIVKYLTTNKMSSLIIKSDPDILSFVNTIQQKGFLMDKAVVVSYAFDRFEDNETERIFSNLADLAVTLPENKEIVLFAAHKREHRDIETIYYKYMSSVRRARFLTEPRIELAQLEELIIGGSNLAIAQEDLPEVKGMKAVPGAKTGKMTDSIDKQRQVLHDTDDKPKKRKGLFGRKEKNKPSAEVRPGTLPPKGRINGAGSQTGDISTVAGTSTNTATAMKSTQVTPSVPQSEKSVLSEANLNSSRPSRIGNPNGPLPGRSPVPGISIPNPRSGITPSVVGSSMSSSVSEEVVIPPLNGLELESNAMPQFEQDFDDDNALFPEMVKSQSISIPNPSQAFTPTQQPSGTIQNCGAPEQRGSVTAPIQQPATVSQSVPAFRDATTAALKSVPGSASIPTIPEEPAESVLAPDSEMRRSNLTGGGLSETADVATARTVSGFITNQSGVPPSRFTVPQQSAVQPEYQDHCTQTPSQAYVQPNGYVPYQHQQGGSIPQQYQQPQQGGPIPQQYQQPQQGGPVPQQFQQPSQPSLAQQPRAQQQPQISTTGQQTGKRLGLGALTKGLPKLPFGKNKQSPQKQSSVAQPAAASQQIPKSELSGGPIPVTSSKNKIDLMKKRTRVLMLTGDRRCGTSGMVANLGQTAAKAGLHTLILDMDLYGRGMCLYFPQDINPDENFYTNSLSNAMRSPHLMDDYVWDINPGLDVLGMDLSVDDIAGIEKILDSEKIQSLIGESRSRYDLVLIDMPFHYCMKFSAVLTLCDRLAYVTENDLPSLVNIINLINPDRFVNHVDYHMFRSKLGFIINRYNRLHTFQENIIEPGLLTTVLNELVEDGEWSKYPIYGTVEELPNFSKQLDHGLLLCESKGFDQLFFEMLYCMYR